MAIETSLDENTCVKGDEKIEIKTTGISEGLKICYRFKDTYTKESEVEESDCLDYYNDCAKHDNFCKQYNNEPVPIIIDNLYYIVEDEDKLKLSYKDAIMSFCCCTTKETHSLKPKIFIYPPESDPECQNVKLNNKSYSLINKWETETSQNYKIMYRNDGELIWKEWKMVPGTNQPEKMYTRVDSNGVYVHILEAKLQHKNFSENNMESLTKTFAYIVKP